MLAIDYRFMPLRLVLKRKEPVKMFIYVKNKENIEESVIVKIMAEYGLSFSKGGLKTVHTDSLDLQPNSGGTITLDIYPTPRLETGYFPLILQFKEYVKNQLIKETEIKAELKVE